MTHCKQLCVELLSELENAIRVIYAEDGTRHISGAYAVINKVKNTLAEPEPEDPTDEDLFSLDQLRDKWNAQADAFNTWDELGIDEIVWWAQRQALARWGNHPGSPDSSNRPS